MINRRPTDWDGLGLRGSDTDALQYGALLWPISVERDGMVFLFAAVEKNALFHHAAQTLAQLGGDKRQMERSVNALEVAYLFDALHDVDTTEQQRMLAQLLSETWGAKLRIDFPDWAFDVEVIDDDEGISVTFSTI